MEPLMNASSRPATAQRSVARWRRGLAAVAALASVSVLAACGGSGSDSEDGKAATFTGMAHAPFQVSETKLTDTDGNKVAISDFTKPLTLVFFGYTNCEVECPLVMNTLSVALTKLDAEDRKNVDLVFVTSDPERDTAPVIRKYLDRYGEGFVGLNGELEDIVDVAKAMAISVNDGVALPDGSYDLAAHSTTISAVSPDKTSKILWDMETSSAEFQADFETILAGKAPTE